MGKPKIMIITQARVGSSRLSGKVLKDINGQTLLELHLKRIKKSRFAQKVIVATTHEDGAEDIVEIARNCGFDAYQGSTDDVLDRYYQAAQKYNPDFVVRLTSDCPLIDPDLIDAVILEAFNEEVDYISNAAMEQFPDGQDIEVFKFSALEKAWNHAKLKSEREHVTPYIRNNGNGRGESIFRLKDFHSNYQFGHIRMTVDEPTDFEAVRILVNELGAMKPWLEYANYISKHPEKFKNQSVRRNEGYDKSLFKDNTD